MIRTDTSATDTTFFLNLASAYRADSQPLEAARTMGRAIGKYPTYTRLHLLRSQFLSQGGRLEESIASVREAIRLDPAMPDITKAYLTIVQGFIELGQLDSVGPLLRQAAAVAPTAEDSNTVSLFALQQGQRALTAARADSTTPGREVAAREKFVESISWFSLADSISASPQAKYQVGVAAFYTAVSISQREVTPNATDKNFPPERGCELGRLGQQYSNMAQLQMRGGGVANPAAAAQIMQHAMGQGPYWDQVIKTYCK